jgi:hexosaminidase
MKGTQPTNSLHAKLPSETCTCPRSHRRAHSLLIVLAALFVSIAPSLAAAQSALFARGYTVIPAPQQVTLREAEFQVDSGWRLVLGLRVPPNDVAVEALRQDLKTRFDLTLQEGGPADRKPALLLDVQPNSVVVGEALDKDRHILAEQAYRIELSPEKIRITANASPGLFYGVETLVQMLKPHQGRLLLPEGEVTDWPDLQLRLIFWDDAHHLERMDAFKKAIRQAAFYKINAIAVKLEGHFQYKSVPVLVEPYALSPEELQELTNYGLRYHLQLVPWLDAPAHVAFILKHPEYARLRAFPDSNYEFCVTNPETIDLLLGMFGELIEANQGVQYIYLSSDEPYYIGLADNAQCREVPRARELGTPGKLEAEFITKLAEPLHQSGRTVVFMGEYPLRPGDIEALPSYLVNTIVNGPEFDPLYRARGIRQMLHTSTQGEERLFPNYFVLPDSELLHTPERHEDPRVQDGFGMISSHSARKQADILGIINAGWADAGLHPETFWLGYVCINAAGWHPGFPDVQETMSSFYRLFYGPGAKDVERLYQLMSHQAQLWSDSWDTVDSTSTKPIFGNSRQIFSPKRPRKDQTIQLPPPPSGPELSYSSSWIQANEQRLRLVAKSQTDNDELMRLLAANLEKAEFNRYNLEVLQSIAKICRQNLEFLQALGRINKLFFWAQSAARDGDAKKALGAIDEALELARGIQRERNRVFHDAVQVWYATWYPRVAEANGRKFVHDLDDVKDHVPDRTVDMSFLVYRQLRLDFGQWFGHVQTSRNSFAENNGLPKRQAEFDWEKLE